MTWGILGDSEDPKMDVSGIFDDLFLGVQFFKPLLICQNSFQWISPFCNQSVLRKRWEVKQWLYLRFLSARLCFELALSCFLFWAVLFFPAPERFDLDLETLTGGLVCWLRLSVSEGKLDRSGVICTKGVFPVREARIVTWKDRGDLY